MQIDWRRLLIGVLGYLAMMAFFVWVVARGPRPGN